MTAKRSRAVLGMFLLCLTTFATSASAECAWVLWKQSYGPSKNEWELQTAYPTVTACTQAIDRREAEARKGIPFLDITRRAATDLFVMEQEGKWGTAWQCFPDTVDPRGPKGK